MKISSINVVLTEEDIMSFVSDFLSGEDFYIDKITLKEGIEVRGRFKKGITISFLVYVNINKVEENKLYVDIKKIKIFKLPILKFIINKVLKVAIDELKDLQIKVENNMAVIDIGKILEESKGFKIHIENIVMNNGQAMVSVKNIMFDIEEMGQVGEERKEVPTKTLDQAKKIVEENIEEETNKNSENKTNDDLPIVISEQRKRKTDIYTKGRKIIIEKMPDQLKPYSEYIFIVPDVTALVGRLLMEDRVPTKTKIIVSAMLGYVIVPGDIINDKIPFIGNIDDLGMVFFAVNRIVNDVPLKVILENWDGEDEIVLILRKTFEYLNKYTTGAKIDKLYSVIESLT